MNKILDVTDEFIRNSKPGIGSITYEEGFDFKHRKHEKETALWLLDNFGGEIIVLKEKMLYKVKNPDYKWNGKFWELKDISTRRSLENGIRKAILQIKTKPGGIIIDLTSYKNKFDSIYGTIKILSSFVHFSNCYIILKKGNILLNIYLIK